MSDDLRTIYKGRLLAVKDLPTLPTALQEVSRLLELPNTTTDQVAKVISVDQVLAAKVLKMVNSPIYGFPGRIGTVKHALVLLGFNVIRGLIISTSVYDDMNRAMRGLWDHSVGCSLACGELARALGMKDPEEYAVAGLLHDLGRLAIYGQLPDHGRLLLAEARARGTTVRSLERDIVGFTHDEMGGAILRQWKCPVSLERNVQRHHTPESSSGSCEPAIMAVSDLLANALSYGTSGEVLVPPLTDEGWAALALPPGAVVQTANQMEYQVLEIIRFLETHD